VVVVLRVGTVVVVVVDRPVTLLALGTAPGVEAHPARRRPMPTTVVAIRQSRRGATGTG
jgi:hypothetical protein